MRYISGEGVSIYNSWICGVGGDKICGVGAWVIVYIPLKISSKKSPMRSNGTNW